MCLPDDDMAASQSSHIQTDSAVSMRQSCTSDGCSDGVVNGYWLIVQDLDKVS